MKLGKNSKFLLGKKWSKFLKGIPRDDKWTTLRLKSWRCERSVQKRIAKSFETFQGTMKMLGKRILDSKSKRDKFSPFLEFPSSRFLLWACF